MLWLILSHHAEVLLLADPLDSLCLQLRYDLLLFLVLLLFPDLFHENVFSLLSPFFFFRALMLDSLVAVYVVVHVKHEGERQPVLDLYSLKIPARHVQHESRERDVKYRRYSLEVDPFLRTDELPAPRTFELIIF